jgi:hypothetical protein
MISISNKYVNNLKMIINTDVPDIEAKLREDDMMYLYNDTSTYLTLLEVQESACVITYSENNYNGSIKKILKGDKIVFAKRNPTKVIYHINSIKVGAPVNFVIGTEHKGKTAERDIVFANDINNLEAYLNENTYLVGEDGIKLGNTWKDNDNQTFYLIRK